MAARTREWESVLLSSGAADAFEATGKPVNEANVIEFLTFSRDNPGSIRNCIECARTNARAVRTALTVEMWEAINGAYLELKAMEAASRRLFRRRPRALPRIRETDLAHL